MFKMTVWDRLAVEMAPSVTSGLPELELVVIDRRGGGYPGGGRDRLGTAWLNCPDPAPLLVVVMIRSALHGVVDAGRGRPRQRRAEHRNGGHQREPHHEGRGRLGRAPRAAHRILPAQAARGAEQAGERAPDDARHGTRQGRRQHRHADEEEDRAQAHQLDGRLREPDGEQENTDQCDHAAPDEATAQGDLILGQVVGHRRHRGDPHGAPRRADGRHHGHADANEEADDHRAGGEHDAIPRAA